MFRMKGGVACLLAILSVGAQAQGPPGPPGDTSALSQKLSGITVTAHNTTSGKRCRLPVVFRGALENDCTPPLVKGSDAGLKCFTQGLAVREKCIPGPGAKPETLLHLLSEGKASDGGLGALCAFPGGQVAALTAARPLPGCVPPTVCFALTAGPLAGVGMGSCVKPDDPDQSKQAAVLESALTPVAAAGAQNVSQAAGPAAAGRDLVDQVTDTGGTTPVGAVTGLSDIGVVPRTTTTGQKCRLPIVHRGRLQLDCFSENGVASCLAAGQDHPLPCAPASLSTANVSLGAMLQANTASDGALGELCQLNKRTPLGNYTLPTCGAAYVCTPLRAAPLEGSGVGFCAVAGQRSAAEAPGPSGPDALTTYTAARRQTVIGQTCRLPVVYGLTLLLDCVPLSGPGAAPECFVEGLRAVDRCRAEGRSAGPLASLLSSGGGTDGLEGSLCAVRPSGPVQARQTCKPSFDCIPLTGPLESSGWGHCVPTAPTPQGPAAQQAGGAQGSGSSSGGEYFVNFRKTVDGRICHLPFVIGGSLFLDCADHGGKSWCRPFRGEQVEVECAPPPAQRQTVALSELMAKGQNMDGARGSLCTATPTWKGGKPVGCGQGLSCEPLIGPLLGTGYGQCVNLRVGEFGMTATMRSLKVQQRHTLSGTPCRLPLVIRNQLVTDCQNGADGRTPQCVTGADLTQLQQCAAAGPSPAAELLPVLLAKGTAKDGLPGALCTLGTASTGTPGDCRLGLKCTNATNPPLFGSQYGYCSTDTGAPEKFMPGPPMTTATPKTRTGQGQPEPSAASQALAELKIPNRVATNNQACRLPLIYRGQLMTDCQTLESGSFEQCFVAKMNAPQPCKPQDLAGPDPVPLGAWLASGKGLDGGEGSFCVLPGPAGMGKAGAQPTDRAPSGGGVGCNAGFSCIPLRASLTNSGYGYCGNAEAGAVATPGPAAPGKAPGGLQGLAVARRQGVSGQTCRLPVFFRDELLTDCKSLDGSPASQCFISGLDVVQDCALAGGAPQDPLLGLLEAGRASDGAEGALCTLPPSSPNAPPVLSQGRPLQCTPGRGLTCLPLPAGRGAGAGLGYCSPRREPSNTTASPLSLPVAQRMAGRQRCRLPLVYKGELRRGCMEVGGTQQCVVGDSLDALAPCTASPTGFNLSTLGALLDAPPEGAADGKEGSLCRRDAASGGPLGCSGTARCVPGPEAIQPADLGFCSAGGTAAAAPEGPSGLAALFDGCGLICKISLGVGAAGALVVMAAAIAGICLCCRRRRNNQPQSLAPRSGSKPMRRLDSLNLADPMADYNAGKQKLRFAATPADREDSALTGKGSTGGLFTSLSSRSAPQPAHTHKSGAVLLSANDDSPHAVSRREVERYEADALSSRANSGMLTTNSGLLGRSAADPLLPGGRSHSGTGGSPFERRLASAGSGALVEMMPPSGMRRAPSLTSLARAPSLRQSPHAGGLGGRMPRGGGSLGGASSLGGSGTLSGPLPATAGKYGWAPTGSQLAVPTPKQHDVDWVPDKGQGKPGRQEIPPQLAGRWSKMPGDFSKDRE